MRKIRQVFAVAAIVAVVSPNMRVVAIPIQAADTHQIRAQLQQGQQVIVQLRDGRQISGTVGRGTSGPMIDSGFNVIQSVGPPVFVLSADVATILDAATGAAIEIQTPKRPHISKRG